MNPTQGRIVRYRLTEGDALAVNQRRAQYKLHAGAGEAYTGHQGHAGNHVQEGDEFPAMVVRVWGSDASVNLQVHLDGTDVLWATSRPEGTSPGCWRWPPREPLEAAFTPVSREQQESALTKPPA